MSTRGSAAARRAPERVINAGGQTIVVRARRNRQARRMILRIDAREDCAILTLPARASLEHGFGFAREKADWLAGKLAALPPRTAFADDATVPFQDAPLLIRHFPLAGDRPVAADGVLYVPGDHRNLADRVTAWFRETAGETLARTSAAKAQEIGLAPPPIGIRDPKARWGSCSAQGRLSFSWRLIMAPPMVLDYVVAHEVAHLKHLNHGAGFKALLARLAPEGAAAQAWLAGQGSTLHRYG